jgi:hypothetical protein
MSIRKIVALGLLALPVVLVGVNGASAQVTLSNEEFIQPQVIDTTFPFEVGGKVVPAGKYDIEQMTQELLVFRPVKGPAIEAKVVTRLAQPATPLVEPKVIFDKVGDKYIASEVWLPGRDGFLLVGTKEKHTHHAIKASPKK